ncbi:hypothetical protein AMTRI_Chr09g12670 [Amborella trichopoda]
MLPTATRPTICAHPIFSLLRLCNSMRDFKLLHAQIITSGLSQDSLSAQQLITFCALSPSGDLGHASRLFESIDQPSLHIYNTIIRAYSKSKTPRLSLSTFAIMLQRGVAPDHYTYPFLIKACSHLQWVHQGEVLHSQVIKYGLEFDAFVSNSLMHMYASCQAIWPARKVFDEMPQRTLVSFNTMLDGYAKCGKIQDAKALFAVMTEHDIVTWSAMIDGLVHAGEYREALSVFDRMQASNVRANDVTIVSALGACAHLGALATGTAMHTYIGDHGFKLNVVLGTAMVDMYAKCGAPNEALRVFRVVPNADLLTWNAVINGMAMNGMSEKALGLFGEMERAGVRPDEITYLGLLCACTHGGFVEDGWRFFNALSERGMSAKVEHCACMVDLLGRAGKVMEAYEFISSMPFEPTSSMLGALLSACKMHGYVSLGERVGKRLIELEPNHDGRYIGLSNVYAAASRWDEARKAREMMEMRGVKKVPGFSSVEVDGAIHRFIADDRTHPCSKEVYLMLNDLGRQIKLQDCLETVLDTDEEG